jgi:hypothetical protein
MLIIDMLTTTNQSVGPSLVLGLATTAPYVKGYSDNAGVFTEYTSYLSATTGSTTYVARYSPLGDVLAVGSQSTPFIHFYDNGAKLSNPATLPSSNVNDLAWSSDGAYCAIATGVSPYVAIYTRSGSTYSKLASPLNILPTSQATGVAFSDDGIYLAAACVSTPYMVWYKRSGATFTKLTNPASIPTAQASNCAWSPSGAYLAVTYSASPYLKIYKRTGDTLSATGVTSPTIAGTSSLGVSWSADGNYLAVCSDASPYLTVLKRSGDTFTKIANPASLPSSTCISVSFSGSDRIAVTNAPFLAVRIYSLVADVLTLVSGTGLPTTDVTSASFYPASVIGSA